MGSGKFKKVGRPECSKSGDIGWVLILDPRPDKLHKHVDNLYGPILVRQQQNKKKIK